MYRRRKSARSEYREQEGQRVRESASLADRFPQLKTLTVALDYKCPDDALKARRLNYVVNLNHAKSVFRFNCPNDECVRGDFDLTEQLANAVARRRTTLTGEIHCPGWRSKTTIGTVPCPNSLRYKLSLGYWLRRASRKKID